jgi:hypothetical protein
MPPVLRRTICLLLALCPLPISAGSSSSHTLKEALADKHLPIDAAKLNNLDKDITSWAELDDANQFVIAYYVDDGTGRLRPPMYLDRYDKKREEWKSATLSDSEPGAGASAVDTPCFGSVLSVQAAGSRLFLDTHVSPSAGCLLVLMADLKLEVGLYGWVEGRIGEDRLVYQRSQVHFAPVHPAGIALFDLRTKREITLFPPKPDSAIRRARTLQLRDFYKGNEEWCNKNNDPCDPGYFDSALQGPVVTSDTEAALAFLISYEQIQLVEGDLQKPSGPKDVLYVYRRVDNEAKMEYREMLLSDAKARFGDVALQNLLQPDTLQKVFADIPAKKP